jgi:general secretion pathway protein K
MNTQPKQQAGAALIVVMVLLTIVVGLLAATFYQHGLDITRVGRMLDSERAALLALSGESWAIQVLKNDGPSIDSLEDDWAIAMPAMPVEGGSLAGLLTDLQGRFNLNNLQRYTGQPLQTNTNNSDIAMLNRLATLTEQNFPPTLIAALIDWLDNDDTLTPGGAEADTYLLQDPPYRPANTLLNSPQELALIAGFEPELVRALQPWVVSLPIATPINVNTASVEVLQALHQDIDASIAQSLVDERTQSPWNSIQNFSQSLDNVLGSTEPGVALRRIQTLPQAIKIKNFNPVSVNSQFFQLSVQVYLGDSQINMESLLYRHNANDIRVLQRTLHYVPAVATEPE